MRKILGVFLVAALATTVWGNTIIPIPNGDFSSPEIVAPATYVIGSPTYWTDTVPSGSGVANAHDGFGPYFFQGLGSGTPTAYLYQLNIGTNYTPGQTYRFEFQYANAQVNAFTLTANLTYAGGSKIALVNTFEVAAASTPGAAIWQTGVVEGVVSGDGLTSETPIEIVFAFQVAAGTENGAHQPLLANVNLSMVPEPATMVIVLLGGLTYIKRRRK